ncbi:MAG: hypothetical protein ABIK89_22590 [Planctomycetota bacterium]
MTATPTTPRPTPAAAVNSTRAARVQEIVDGAHVRQALGQAALHELRNGEHVIIFRGERFVASSVDEAIDQAAGRRLPTR